LNLKVTAGVPIEDPFDPADEHDWDSGDSFDRLWHLPDTANARNILKEETPARSFAARTTLLDEGSLQF
jgi:hypothetical protein